MIKDASLDNNYLCAVFKEMSFRRLLNKESHLETLKNISQVKKQEKWVFLLFFISPS